MTKDVLYRALGTEGGGMVRGVRVSWVNEAGKPAPMPAKPVEKPDRAPRVESGAWEAGVDLTTAEIAAVVAALGAGLGFAKVGAGEIEKALGWARTRKMLAVEYAAVVSGQQSLTISNGHVGAVGE